MKFFALIFVLIISCSHKREEQVEDYSVSENLFDNFKLGPDFEGRPEIKIMEAPVKSLQAKLVQDYPEAELFGSNDSKMQIMTPFEYQQLRSVLSENEIHEIAKKSFLQNSRFTVRCIGKDFGKASGEEYFILVDSNDVIRYRLRLLHAYLEKGGESERFFPTEFTPFIPLAQTDPKMKSSFLKTQEDCIRHLDRI
jgi:hypothetical protein